MSAGEPDTLGPYIVWSDYGYDGWHPHSFATLEEALAYQGYGELNLITKRVKFKVVEHE